MMKKKSPETAVQDYLINHYGNLILAEPPKFDERTRLWKSELKSNYPRIIRNEEDRESIIIKFLNLYGLGEIDYDVDSDTIKGTSREDCIKSLDDRVNMWKDRAEKIVVRASSMQLASVSGINALDPIKMIIDNLGDPHTSYGVKITDKEIGMDDQPERITQYLTLLEGLSIVRRVEDGYTYGNLFEQLWEKSNNDYEKLKTYVISEVIRERYSQLRHGFNITQLERHVRLENCYYWFALDAEQTVKTSKETLFERYSNFYAKIPPLSLKSILRELVRIGTLEEDSHGLYKGKDALFNQMKELRTDYRDLNPTIMA